MIKLVKRKHRSTESWPASVQRIHGRVATVAVCVGTSMVTIVPRLHYIDSNKPATEGKPREENTADAVTTNAESTQTPDLPHGNEAITISTADGKQESVPTEKDGAESVQRSANVDKDAVGNTAEVEEREATATNQDEHDDHIVEGEEDTVIY